MVPVSQIKVLTPPATYVESFEDERRPKNLLNKQQFQNENLRHNHIKAEEKSRVIKSGEHEGGLALSKNKDGRDMVKSSRNLQEIENTNKGSCTPLGKKEPKSQYQNNNKGDT